MTIRVQKIEKEDDGEVSSGRTNTYLIMEKGKEFLINYVTHPHHGASLLLAGQKGTLHVRAEDNTVVRQLVALGGGCALAIQEDVVEGLSPDSLSAVIMAEQTGEVMIRSEEPGTESGKA